MLLIVAVADSWSPAAFSALAAWATVGIAALAGTVAVRQLGEARKVRQAQEASRREQVQPNVVAYIQQNEAEPVLIELVVRNFGVTPAYEVRLNITPAPVRAIDASDSGANDRVWLPERLPVLVPGQEWRTLWDSGLSRYGKDLPDRHDATVKFRDSGGTEHTTRAILDWRMVWDREQVTVYGIHHAAKALRDIEKTVKRWGDQGGGRGLLVWARDGDERQRRQKERVEAMRAEREAQAGANPDNAEAAGT
jgi:hypothetical protein